MPYLKHIVKPQMIIWSHSFPSNSAVARFSMIFFVSFRFIHPENHHRKSHIKGLNSKKNNRKRADLNFDDFFVGVSLGTYKLEAIRFRTIFVRTPSFFSRFFNLILCITGHVGCFVSCVSLPTRGIIGRQSTSCPSMVRFWRYGEPVSFKPCGHCLKSALFFGKTKYFCRNR